MPTQLFLTMQKLKRFEGKIVNINQTQKNLTMKRSFSLLSAALLLAFTSCNSNKNNTADTDTLSTSTENQSTMSTSNASYEVKPGNYVDLKTGKKIYVVRDPQTGYAIDSIARTPIEFYFDPTTHDTIYQTGMIVNHQLIKSPQGTWSLSEDAKVKMNGDKMKMENDTTKIKVKDDKTKIKQGDSKTKIEGGEVKTK
jgi:hypothetical protein